MNVESVLLYFGDSSVINYVGVVYLYLVFYWGNSDSSFLLAIGECESLLVAGLSVTPSVFLCVAASLLLSRWV